MNKFLKFYELIFIVFIYLIIAFYSIRAMFNLIEEERDASKMIKLLILDTCWLTIIVALGLLIVSTIVTYKKNQR